MSVMRKLPCRACDKPYPVGTGCTNRLCESCHRRFCTPGGTTSPGHGIDIDKARAAMNRSKK